jgi:hypothetical protein
MDQSLFQVESQTGQATIFLRDLAKNIKKDTVVILVQVPGHVINFQGDVWQPTELPNYTLPTSGRRQFDFTT